MVCYWCKTNHEEPLKENEIAFVKMDFIVFGEVELHKACVSKVLDALKLFMEKEGKK